MGDPTRKDNGAGTDKLFVTIELDLTTSLSTIETNVADPAVMMRVIGQGMQVWSDDRMKKIAEAMKASAGKRPLVLVPNRDGN